MALKFDNKGVSRLHNLVFPKIKYGQKGKPIDEVPKSDTSMDKYDLDGNNAESFEQAVIDMVEDGQNTELLVNDDALVNEIVAKEMINTDNPSLSLEESINSVNKFFSGMGYDDISTFMHRVAAVESAYGEDQLGDYSYGAFQIDPIKYQDIVDRAKGGGAAGQRVQAANEFLREQMGNPDFDLLTHLEVDAKRNEEGYVTEASYIPNQALRDHNPLIASVLTRLGLANIEPRIEADFRKQAVYWKDHWNKSGAGDADKFMQRVRGRGHGKSWAAPVNWNIR